ncbi:hypothetical protein Tco_0914429, partial [Tanacetum coccineum]
RNRVNTYAISLHNEETIGRYLEESTKRQDSFKEWMKRFRECTDKNLNRHDSTIKGLDKKIEQLAQAVHASMTNDSKLINQVKTIATKNSSDTHYPTSLNSNTILCTSIISNLNEHGNVKKTDEHDKSPRSTPIIHTFAEKVKKRITEEQEKTFLESLEKIPANTPLINTLKQTLEFTKNLRELMSKKARSRSNMTMSNALADLGASINLMPFSLFKRLGLVDFVILDIVEDDKVPIILGRPMLATAHVRMDVFGKKISLEVPNGFGEQENLEDFLMNDEINRDFRDFLELDDLFPIKSVEPFGVLSDSKSEMGIGLEDFNGNLEDLLDKQAIQFRQNEDGIVGDLNIAHGSQGGTLLRNVYLQSF